MNPKRLVDLGFGVAGIVAFFVFGQFLSVLWDYFRWPMGEDWVVSIPDAVSVALGIAVFFTLRSNQVALSFCLETVGELSKVTWPVRKETLLSTVIVIILTGIAAMILFLFDTIWGSVTQTILAK